MKKLMEKPALTATAIALALMVALSLSGRWALPATANDGVDLVTSPTKTPTTTPTATSTATPTATPTPGSGGGSDLATSPTATPTVTPTATSTSVSGGSVTDSTCVPQPPAGRNPGGKDTDCDGLIEIATFAQLNTIRYDTAAGNVGLPEENSTAYHAVFKTHLNSGCPISEDNKPVCTGYELVADIQMTGIWTPMGWGATLDGNGHVISGMVVNVTGSGGMFSHVGGEIRNLGLRDAVVRLTHADSDARGAVGILAGGVGGYGEIKTSWATGNITYAGAVRGADVRFRGPRADIGGLVGRNNGTIIASWADVDILLDTEGARAGGLVGSQKGVGRFDGAKAAKIVGSVAYGDITVTTPGFGRVGGFIGMNMNLNEHEHSDGTKEITDIMASYAYGEVLPVLKSDFSSWSNSGPRTATGVFGCNASPATLTNVYYDGEIVEGGCSSLYAQTSP